MNASLSPPVYFEQQALSPLRSFVECVWWTESVGASLSIVPPDGCLDIVYSPELGLRVVGAMTAQQEFYFRTATRVVGLRFRPGMARSFVQIPLHELTNKSVPLADLWPRRAFELREQLADAPSPAHAIDLLQRRLGTPRQEIARVQQAIGALVTRKGQACLAQLSDSCGISARQFRRLCLEESGLAPKQLSRILRFRRAREIALRGGHPNWPAIANEAGYFDQAHLIRDFKEFTGRTPAMSVLSNTAHHHLS